MDGYVIPHLPGNEHYGLIPFARIKTTRSSWSKKVNSDNSSNRLNVDIDCTDFGYMVGEVEIVVEREKDIIPAKETVAKTIELISGDDEPTKILGKLEFYLIQNRKSHFDACVRGRSMRE